MLNPVQQYQYGTTLLIISTKEGAVRFITDYCRLHLTSVRNPYILPTIGKTMQNLEGFHYMTALDINMGYYTMRLSPAIQDMMTIVT